MTDNRSPQPEAPAYRVIQKGAVGNIGVSDFDGLVTHHPHENAGARVVNGIVAGGEAKRRHAVISGEIDEIAVGTPSRTLGLAPGQILQKKDFILENPDIASGGKGRPRCRRSFAVRRLRRADAIRGSDFLPLAFDHAIANVAYRPGVGVAAEMALRNAWPTNATTRPLVVVESREFREDAMMSNELSRLTVRNLAALGLAGFSASFAVFLLHGLYVERGSLVSSALNLAAAVILIAVCAVSWPAVLAPSRARTSWKSVMLVILACVLAVAARLPGLQG